MATKDWKKQKLTSYERDETEIIHIFKNKKADKTIVIEDAYEGEYVARIENPGEVIGEEYSKTEKGILLKAKKYMVRN